MDVVGEAGAEVEVEAAKVHLLEVLAIVHVTKKVDVSGPAEAVEVTDTIADVDWRHQGLDEFGEGESEDPVDIKEGDEEKEIEQHGGTVEILLVSSQSVTLKLELLLWSVANP